jgi:glutathione synthase/RimK-type ligase-like ATP-grasp enzyme
VLALTRADDPEIDELSLFLAAEGIPLIRIDSDRCRDRALSWDPLSGVLTWEGERFRPLVSWLRYFTVESMDTASPDTSFLGTDGRTVALYAREQWTAFVTTVVAGTRAINPGCLPGVPDRLSQLAAARAVGLPVPASVVTTRLADAADSIPGDGDLLVKSLGKHLIEDPPGRMRGVFPRRITRRELAAEQGVEPAPVLVQEFVAAPRELRVNLVGGRLIPYAITRPSPESPWTEPDAIVVEPVVLTPELCARLTRLAGEFDLDIAAFDLLDAPEPVFLEVNPEGSWLWAERRTGSSLTSRAARDLVVDLFRKELHR